MFKEGFYKLLSLEWKYFKKTLIKKSVFQNIKQVHNTGKTIGCFAETIGCLYQLSNNKTEFKEIGIERLHTDVYTGSLQTQSYIQSSQKPWGNPLRNHNLITFTTTKRMTLNTSRHTLFLANTPTSRLLILIPSRTHSNLSKHRNETCFTKNTRIKLVTEDNLKSIQAESYSTTLINHKLSAISALWKTKKLLAKTCHKQSVVSSNQSVVLVLNSSTILKTVFNLFLKTSKYKKSVVSTKQSVVLT